MVRDGWENQNFQRKPQIFGIGQQKFYFKTKISQSGIQIMLFLNIGISKNSSEHADTSDQAWDKLLISDTNFSLNWQCLVLTVIQIKPILSVITWAIYEDNCDGTTITEIAPSIHSWDKSQTEIKKIIWL